MPLFSVITTCYNRAGTVGKTIESLLAQTCNDVEYIVVDGASADGSWEKIQSYGSRIDKMVSEPDDGMYQAINKGIRMASGDYILLLHSDDVMYDAHVLSDVAAWLAQHPQTDLLYADGIYVSADNPQHVVRNWRGHTFHRWKLRTGWLPLHTTCFIRRQTMMEHGLYDERYKIAADTDLLLRYIGNKNICVGYYPRYIVRMLMGGMSTDSARRKKMWREDVDIYRRHRMPGTLMKLMKMAHKVPQYLFTKPHKE
ncbi:MAG: glycosyltransferase [Bacteroidaceae bacterium]|nr:glycosyltransferase [Bacteroidaceae bacterium]